MHTDDDVVVLFHVVKVFGGRGLVAKAGTWAGEQDRVGLAWDDARVRHARSVGELVQQCRGVLERGTWGRRNGQAP